jgi:hypothetical protein
MAPVLAPLSPHLSSCLGFSLLLLLADLPFVIGTSSSNEKPGV